VKLENILTVLKRNKDNHAMLFPKLKLDDYEYDSQVDRR
jgi:hypothetical protein